MRSAIEKVEEFHLAFGVNLGDEPKLPTSVEERKRRVWLLREEFLEYLDGEKEDDLIEIADGLADMMYILIGTALSYGIPIERVFNEVHSSNMTKLGEDGKPILRGDGKILKPKGFKPVNLSWLL